MLEVPQPAIVVHRSLIEFYRDRGRLVEALEVAKREALLAAQSGTATKSLVGLIELYAMLSAGERVAQWRGRAGGEATLATTDRLALLVAAMLPAGADHAATAAEFREILAAGGLDLDGVALGGRMRYGELLALGGEFASARRVLEAAVDPGVAVQERDTDQEIGARHALAWAWLRSGEAGRAHALLALIGEHLRGLEAEGRLHRSTDLFEYARNRALLDDTEGALELLERAERAGWRGYYAIRRDPRWDTLRAEPRFEAVMTRVRTGLDAQLAEVERLEAQDDFAARFEAAIASRNAGGARP